MEESTKFREELEVAQNQHRLEMNDLLEKKQREMEEFKRKTEEDIAKRQQAYDEAIKEEKKDIAEMYKAQVWNIIENSFFRWMNCRNK